MEDFDDKFLHWYEEIDTGFILRASEEVSDYLKDIIESDSSDFKCIKLVPL